MEMLSLKHHHLKAIWLSLFLIYCSAVKMSTEVHILCLFALLAFSLLLYQMNIHFSVLGDAGEKFGEKMQSLFLHENPQVN